MVGEPELIVLPDRLDFSVQVGCSETRTIEAANTGDVSLSFTPELSGSTAFSVSPADHLELAPGERETIYVTCAPIAAGELEAELEIEDTIVPLRARSRSNPKRSPTSFINHHARKPTSYTSSTARPDRALAYSEWSQLLPGANGSAASSGLAAMRAVASST